MSHTITVYAGYHPRHHCPLRIPWPHAETPASLEADSRTVPVQKDGDHLVFITHSLYPEQAAVYRPSGATSEGGVALFDLGDRIRVEVNGEEFTNYWYKDIPSRPYFWPVHAPGGIAVTRAYPMRQDVPGEKHDHQHHRSMYFAFGAVNGTDNWSEEKGHGYTIHRTVDELVSGPVFGRFTTTSDWTDKDRKKILTQTATLTFWRSDPSLQLMDVDLRLTATEGDVFFGDTKEGGLISVRVATVMDVASKQGGRIENAYGGINEGETWGRAAHWCDYSGVVGGKPVGIAVMDHPLSFRYPTYWHVRDYGLMCANPFALSAYTGGLKDGSYLLKAGETMRFIYRVAVHHGNAATADVRNRYLDFVSPPSVEVS